MATEITTELYSTNKIPYDQLEFIKITKFIKYNNEIIGYFTVYDRNIYLYIDDIKIVYSHQKLGIGSHIMNDIIYM